MGDVAESFSYVKYNRTLNNLNIFADDTSARWLTSSWCVYQFFPLYPTMQHNVQLCVAWRVETNELPSSSFD